MSRAPLLKTLHRYLGLGLGILFAVSAASGAVLILKPWLESSGSEIRPAPDDRATAAVVDRALERHGVDGFNMVQLPTDRRPDYQVWYKKSSVDHIEYVDSGSLEPLRIRSSDRDWLLKLFHLHTELLSGPPGERLLGVVGFIYLGLIVSGLVLWWPGVARLRRNLMPPNSVRLQARALWLHRLVGALTAPLLLIAVLTGLGMIHYEATQNALLALTGTPRPVSPPTSVNCPAGSVHVSWEAQLGRVRDTLPEARLIRIYPATGADRPSRFRLKHPQEWHQNGRSLVYLNPCDGSVIFSQDARRLPMAVRISHAIYPVHSAHIGGGLYRALMLAVAFMPLLLFLTGVLTWWKRRRR